MDKTPMPSRALHERHAIINQFLDKKPLIRGAVPTSPTVFMKDDQCLYAIPMPVLNAIASTADISRLLTPGELQSECAFATHCSDQKILGYSARGPIVFPLLLPLEKKPDQPHASRWEQLVAWTQKHHAPKLHIDVQASLDGLQFGQKVLLEFDLPRLAYQGWLLTNHQFQQEKEVLRNQWIKEGSNPAYLAGRNHLRQRHDLPAQAMYGWRLHSDIGDDFLSFYRRWELNGLATWDLPIQQEPNLGGPSELGQLMDLHFTPAIQLPSTMKLPAKFPMQTLFSHSPADHLASWHRIVEQKQTKRLAEEFVIHFYQDIVLKRIFGEHLNRCQGKLDNVVAEAFKLEVPLKTLSKMPADTIKKIRQSLLRRK